MAAIASHEGLRPSMLDRIVDPESEGTNRRRGFSVDQVIDAVRRDLEDLLNSRRTNLHIPEGFAEVRQSIVAYGFPDPSSFDVSASNCAPRVCAAIEETIAMFEPRLTDVQVISVKRAGSNALRLDFEVRGTLILEPSPEVTFVTIVKLTTGEATVARG